jgi:hypothetical protein
LIPFGGTPISVQAQTGYFINAYPIPAGVTDVQLTFTAQQNPAHGSVVMYAWTAAGAPVGGESIGYLSFNGANGGPIVGTRASLPTAKYWSIHGGNGFPNQVSVEAFDIDFQFFCGGGASAPITPCCPPDPALQSQLSQILNLLNSIYSGMAPPPRSYAESTVHAGLTGGGTIAIQPACVAVKVTITTDNPALPSRAGSPLYLFDRGFIVPIAAEGPIRGQTRLVYNPQLYVLPPLTDHVGYQFGTGVTGSITELLRGP